MTAFLHHIVIDTHDLPALARFWVRVLDPKILSGGAGEIVIGTHENAAVGICFTPVTDVKRVKNRLHFDLTRARTAATPRSSGSSRSAPAGPASGRPATSRGPCSPTRRATSSASCGRRRR